MHLHRVAQVIGLVVLFVTMNVSAQANAKPPSVPLVQAIERDLQHTDPVVHFRGPKEVAGTAMRSARGSAPGSGAHQGACGSVTDATLGQPRS